MYLLKGPITDSEGGVKNVASMILTASASWMAIKMDPGEEQVLETR